MLGSKARHRRGLLPLLILFLLLSPAAQGQVPEPEMSDDFYAANVLPQQGSATIPYLGSANIPLVIEDVSTASNEDQTTRERNRIYLSVDVLGNNTQGWSASTSTFSIATRPGQTHQVNLNIQAGATIDDPTVEVRVQATYDAAAGEDTVANASVMAVAESFPRVTMQMDGLPDDFEPDQTQKVGFTVTNNNYYPEMVSFQVDGPEDWLISPPSSVRLAPGETKTVYIDVKSPQNPWFLYTSSSEFISVDAVAGSNGQTMMTTGVPVSQTGVNFPAWATPHLFMLLIGAGMIAVRTRRKVQRWKLEKGKPSYPGLDPEHEADLAALEIEDPEQAETIEARLETLYEQRKEAWKEAYDRRKRAEEDLEEAYRERHEALVAARDADEDPDRRARAQRRRLLERKRQLLERKRQQLGEDGSSDEGPTGPSAAPD